MQTTDFNLPKPFLARLADEVLIDVSTFGEVPTRLQLPAYVAELPGNNLAAISPILGRIATHAAEVENDLLRAHDCSGCFQRLG